MIYYNDNSTDMTKKLDIAFLKEIILENTCASAWNCKKVYHFPVVDFSKPGSTTFHSNHICPLKKEYCRDHKLGERTTIIRNPNFRKIAIELYIKLDPENAESFIFEHML